MIAKRSILRRILRVGLWFITGILVLLILLVGFLVSPPGKRVVRDQLLGFLRHKLKTEVQLAEIQYELPKMVGLKGLLLRDQQRDTLLSAGTLKIDIDLLQLLRKQISVNDLILEDVVAKVHRNAPDTNYNFTFIIEAFAGAPDTSKQEEKPASPFVFDVGRVQLNRIRLAFEDETGGMNLHTQWEKLDLWVREIVPDKMIFRLKKVELLGFSGSIQRDSSLIPVPPDTGRSVLPTIGVDELQLKKVDFAFADRTQDMQFSALLGSLALQTESIDLNEQIIKLKSLDGETANAAFSFRSANASASDTAVVSAPWRVSADKVDLRDFAFRMDDQSQAKSAKGIDYAHLDLQRVTIRAKDLLYAPDRIAGTVQQISVWEQSGIGIKQLNTQFYYSDTGLALQELFIETEKSLLRADASLAYTSPEDFKTRLADLPVSLQLKDCSLDWADVRIFAPQLDTMKQLAPLKSKPIFIDLQAQGTVGALQVDHIRMLAATNTMLVASGKINGITDANHLAYALKLEPLRSSRQDISPFLPPASRDQFRLPDHFSVSGLISGTTRDYFPDLVVRSSDGDLRLSGAVQMSPGKGRERYRLHVQTKALDLGRLLRKDTLLGPLTAVVSVQGVGFDPKQMSAKVDAAIRQAFVKGYAYRDVRMNGDVARQKGRFNLISDDPNVQLKMNADADFSREFMALYAKVAIDSFDAYATKLSTQPLKLKANLDLSAPVLSPDYPEADLLIINPSVATAGQIYVGDTLTILSKPTTDSGQHITADLDFLRLNVIGKTPLRAIMPAINEHVNRHYRLPVSGEPDTAGIALVPKEYDLSVDASVFRSPLLVSFVPGLKQLDTVQVAARLDQKTARLNLDAAQINYNEQQLTGLKVAVQEADSAFTYAVLLDRFTGGSLRLHGTELRGAVDSDRISARLSTKDETSKERFRLGADLRQEQGAQVISVHPDMLLDYKNWSVAQPNRLVMQGNGMFAENLVLRGNGAEIAVNSETASTAAPMNVRISGFEIADITRLLSGDTALASGVLAGTATLKSLRPAPLFDADMSIQQLAVKGDTLGNLSVKATNDQQQTIATQLSLSGNGNQLELKGNYYAVPSNGNDLDMQLQIRSLNLKSMEGLAGGQIKQSSGGLTSDVRIHGTFKAPLLDGNLRTQNLQTTVTPLNAVFKMPSETLLLKGQELQFDRFKILDSSGNTATIDGNIQFRDMANPIGNLAFDARNWKALSAARGANEFAYGNLVLSSHLSIDGPLRQPSLGGSLTIEKGTNLSILLPESGTAYEDYSGIVVFKDSRHPDALKPLVLRDTLKTPAMLAGSDINVNLLTSEDAEFNVIIDQATGDFLNVRGKAQVNTSMDRGGTLTMNGIYEISGGAYQLNYNLIRRKFDISKGSTITFAGDPLDADMNITAVYKANVPPYDLVERQVPDQSQLVYYRQSLPFEVQLKMNGPVMTPLLNFDIVLPENQTYRLSSDAIQLVQAKLSQLRIDTSELNKQVFALLILKRFITDDPFSSGTGTTAEFAAKQSVSRFIGEQLNQIAGQLINGFDLSVDLASTEDYTSGTRRERTDLSVAASKRLLNDRLKVTIGNNFELEGPQTKSNNANSSLIPGNLAVDYSLSSDNRYTVRAYRQTLDQGVIQGFVTETGLNFIVNYDYNRFRNLFISRRKLLERRQQRKGIATPLIQKK